MGGVDSQLAHGKIRQMSGGQRQRLVISAAFWSKPHVIALDEPTNYLDNDSVAALTKALKDFKGAVLTVSENEAFTAEISNEKWVVENGAVTIVQLRDAKCRWAAFKDRWAFFKGRCAQLCGFKRR